MNRINVMSWALAAALGATGVAQAETETWHLEGTIYQTSEFATKVPDGLRMAQPFTVDYVIDNSVQLDDYGYDFFSVVQQISINGISSVAGGYVSARGLGLNVVPNDPILDINFVSFNALNLVNNEAPPKATSVHDLLLQYGLSPLTGDGDIRFDFNGPESTSVWGQVTSFAPAVPEPSTAVLGALGLVALVFASKRQKSI